MGGGSIKIGGGVAQICLGANLPGAGGDEVGLALEHEENRRSAGLKLPLLTIVLFFGKLGSGPAAVSLEREAKRDCKAFRTSASMAISIDCCWAASRLPWAALTATWADAVRFRMGNAFVRRLAQ